jgi:hypothetical protein
MFTFEEISGNETLESSYNNNMIKTNFYLRNPSKYFLQTDDLKNLNNFDELTNYKNNILNVLKKMCVEHDIIKQNDSFDIEDVLLKLDKNLGFRVDFPDIFDKDEFEWLSYLNYNADLVSHSMTTFESVNKHWEEYGIGEKRVVNGSIGLLTSRGVISKSYMNSLAYVFKIKKVIGNNYRNATIYDINGGIGTNVYYLKKMGFNDIILVNKPEQCLLASYYLLSLFTEDDITLFDEETDNSILIVPNYKYVGLLDSISYFIHCDGENVNVVNSSEFDPRDFDKKFILISN